MYSLVKVPNHDSIGGSSDEREIELGQEPRFFRRTIECWYGKSDTLQTPDVCHCFVLVILT